MITDVIMNVKIRVSVVHEPETRSAEELEKEAETFAVETIRGRGMEVISMEITDRDVISIDIDM